MCHRQNVDKLATLSKDDLLRRAQSLQGSIKRAKNATENLGGKVERLIGGATATATGFGIGYIETSVRNKDGTPMSLGPLPLALAVGGALSLGALFFDPMGQVSAAAAGAMGAYGATMGRGAAMKAAADKVKPKVSGQELIGASWDQYSDGEAALLG